MMVEARVFMEDRLIFYSLYSHTLYRDDPAFTPEVTLTQFVLGQVTRYIQEEQLNHIETCDITVTPYNLDARIEEGQVKRDLTGFEPYFFKVE